jgi:multiple sugar transport system permease protein
LDRSVLTQSLRGPVGGDPAGDDPVGGRALLRRIGRRGLQPRFLPYLFVAATVVVLAGLSLIPLAYSISGSLHRGSLLSTDHSFIGLQNYISVLTDPAFQTALKNTLAYLVYTDIGVLIVGLPIALWLRGLKRRRRAVMLTIVLIPWAVPGTVNGELWSLIFKPTNGLLNSFLLKLHIIHSNFVWLEGPKALPLVSLTLIWQTVPIAALIMLAGLEYIPGEIYEQARIDGASNFQTLRRVTLPLLRPAVAISLVVSSISAIGIYDQIYVLTGNAQNTISVVQQTYLYAFKVLDFGYAVSAAMIGTIASVIVSLVILRFIYREIAF